MIVTPNIRLGKGYVRRRIEQAHNAPYAQLCDAVDDYLRIDMRKNHAAPDWQNAGDVKMLLQTEINQLIRYLAAHKRYKRRKR